MSNVNSGQVTGDLNFAIGDECEFDSDFEEDPPDASNPSSSKAEARLRTRNKNKETSAESENADVVIGDLDCLIGDESDFDSDFEEDPPDASNPSNSKAKVQLRVGNKKVSAELAAEAAQHLQALPADYDWIVRLPEKSEKPKWEPHHQNDPQGSPNLIEKSLLYIFIEMSEGAVTHMVNCTNKLGSIKYPRSWPTLTIPRVALFMAIVFHMDAIERASLNSYWMKKSGDEFVQSTKISRNMFLKWYSTIRLYDPDSYTKKEKDANKIHKVEKYLYLAQLGMQAMRHTVNQKISLDEEMTTFKGRCGLVQLIKNKPRGEGLKYYALCDPQSGYLYATMLHSGTHVKYQEVWGRIVAICFKLLSGDSGTGLCNYLDQGYYVYTDRYYTTVHMNFAMAQRRTYLCGTLRREQRSSLPVDIMMGTRRGGGAPLAVRQMKRGEVLRRYSNYGLELLVNDWMDSTLVTFLTSIDDASDEPLVCYRKGKSRKGVPFRQAVCQPVTAKDFSENMGGVDIHDQNTTTTKSHHRSRRWYMSGVFLQSLDWFLHNTFVLWKDFNPNSKLLNKDMKQRMAESLRDFALAATTMPPTVGQVHQEQIDFTSTKDVPMPSSVDLHLFRFSKDEMHFPRKFEGRGRECIGHMQRVSTVYFCMACKVFLCVKGGCFARFHMMRDYLYNDPLLSEKPKIRTYCKYY